VRLVPRIVVAPNQEPPAKGDLLVAAQGPRTGQVLTPDSVPVDGMQVFAWPMDPASRVVKSGDTHNLLLLVRAADKGWYSTPDVTAQSVAAYSAVCTHLCCTVSEWRAASPGARGHGELFCPCHLSRFDPWDRARVLAGPAPRPLPALPLATDQQGRLIVAGGFLTQVGCAT
jgi:rieske iron-sulfur protein